MKRSKLFSLSLLLLTAGTFLASCSDKDEKKEDKTVLNPISQHLVGRWNCDGGYVQEPGGQWKPLEDGIADDRALIYNFRADGSAYRLATNPDRWSYFLSGTWSADEENQRILLNERYRGVETLTETSFEYSENEAYDDDGNHLDGLFKWHYTRMKDDDLSLGEQLLGKWEFVDTYEKVDGQWVVTDFGRPDEASREFREDGTAGMSTTWNGQTREFDSFPWEINLVTSQIKLLPPEGIEAEPQITKVAVEDGNMVWYYPVLYDVVPPEYKEGEFKDVFVRVQE